MRTVAVVLFVIWYLIFMLPVHIVAWAQGKKDPNKRFAIGYASVKWAFSLCLFFAGNRLEVIGKENIPEGACLFAGNHRSYFDILITHTNNGRPTGYVAKKEILKAPLLPLYMKDIGCIFLDRDNPKEGLKSVLQGAEYLKNGHSMFIFPEGTRNHNEELLPFKEGSLKMAEKAKVPICPVAIINSDRHMELNGKGLHIRKAKVKLIYGKPFYISDLEREDRKKSAAYTQARVQELIDANK